MQIKQIKLVDFRNFDKREIKFADSVNVIVGANATGKTNILESIYLLSTGKSFKARLEEEMIGYDASIARSCATLSIKNNVLGENIHNTKHPIQDTNLEVVLTRGEIQIGDDPVNIQKVPRKKLLVNGISRRIIDFSGILKVALFGPWDLDLVTESPSLRRKFLDSVLSQSDREYRRAIISYEKGLRQRNRLLFRIREEGVARSQLLFWDKLLIKNGDYISDRREKFIEFVNKNPDFLGQDFSLVYDKSAISEARLEQYKNEEVCAAATLVGPHRDDFIFKVKGPGSKKAKERDLAKYGSRGEARMGVLWLKMSELSFIEKSTGERPLLLLDDIFSELDHQHRGVVTDLAKKQQTIITTADPHYVENLQAVEKIVLKS